MENVSKKLFHENRELLHEICRDFNEMKPLFQNVQEAYRALDIGELSNEIFKEIVESGDMTKINELFNEGLNNQLDEMKVTSKIMREKMIEDHRHLIDDFNESVNRLKAFKPYDIKMSIGDRNAYLRPNQVSFVGSQFVVSKDDKENILENYCRTYISNEEVTLLEKFEKLAATYSDLKEFMIMNSFSEGFLFSSLSPYIIEGDNSSPSIYKSCGVEVNKKTFIGLIGRAKFIKNNS